MDSAEKKSKKVVVTRKVRIHSTSIARPQPPEYITITYQTVGLTQGFNGTLILSVKEMEDLDIRALDHLEIAVTKVISD